MNNMQISSFHADPLVPLRMGNLGEYNDWPERFDPKYRSVIERLAQFGVDIDQIEKRFGKKIIDLNEQEYCELLAESIGENYAVIVPSIFDKYLLNSGQNPDNEARWRELESLFEAYSLIGENPDVHLIKRGADFQETGNLVLGLEAGAHLITDMSRLKNLEGHGIKLFGLQYNEDTPLATGEGLTKFGIEAVKYLFQQNLIIDLAHSGSKTRRDVMDLAEDLSKGHLVSYTHGSTVDDLEDSWKLKMAERALAGGEVDRLVRMGALIGLGVSRPFFGSISELANGIDRIAQKAGGVNNIAIGTDFGGVPPQFLHEIQSPLDFHILAERLSQDFGMSDEDIRRVISGNVRAFIEKAID